MNDDGTVNVCDDGNPCTVESCDPVNGCSSDGTEITIACDDGNACATGETCQGDAAGTCGGGNTLACDDGNPCTADTCDPSNGCSSDGTGITIACDEECNACTTETETCQGDAAGTCAGTPQVHLKHILRATTVYTKNPMSYSTHIWTRLVAASATVPALPSPVHNDGNACTSGETCRRQFLKLMQPAQLWGQFNNLIVTTVRGP